MFFVYLHLWFFMFNLKKGGKMPIFLTALRWFGTVALGWLGSDIFNETQTTSQVTPVAVGTAAKNSLKNRGWLYALAFVVIIILVFVLKKFKIFKSK